MQVFMTLQHAETLQLRVNYKHQDVTICEEVLLYISSVTGIPIEEYFTIPGRYLYLFSTVSDTFAPTKSVQII